MVAAQEREAEARGKIIDCADKVVCQQARITRRLPWDEKTARLFACDCAQSVAHLNDNENSQIAIDLAIGHAMGVVDDDTLSEAGDAAWDVARDVASAAAWDAASNAACNAAWDKQTDYLFKYLEGKIK